MVEFASQTVAVVGAASGIGRAAAVELAGRGARVVCLDLDHDGAKTVAAALPHDATAVHVDVTSQESVRTAFDSAGADLHALVNCAGTTGRTGRPTHEVDVDDFDLVYRVNLRGALLLSQAVVPGMVERGYGRVLHVASIAGKEGNAGMAAYSATKAGLIGLVKSMGKEYATSGVTVNALAPAVIQTPMVEAMPEHQVRYMTEKIPMGRLGTLDEAARMIAWIVSTDCSFSTGFTFDLTGGRAVY
ncbi:SDR family oxidoreductase [Jiangella ureilytica]|uniref:SDR family oxidoreductase n=1 Tax=Jiangella ureilytica TaxID=2530374 RepID=A0A4R4RMS1_9ACTN|nr:SDR family NAD(P)-dependent oxidoreductase [Jiangella ureilytica]TDC50734.1 SDR family oxidoreductase [Jiangella ureilytica]